MWDAYEPGVAVDAVGYTAPAFASWRAAVCCSAANEASRYVFHVPYLALQEPSGFQLHLRMMRSSDVMNARADDLMYIASKDFSP